MSRKFQNILVTGGSGFIGSNFIHTLLNKNKNLSVFNLDKLSYASNNKNLADIQDNSNYEFIHGDICDKDLVSEILKENSIDCIVNFAAESHVDNSIASPDEFLNTNIMGTFSLLQASLDHFNSSIDKNFIFLHVSTDEVYGSLKAEDKSFTEENQFLPNSPYSASKAASDMIVRAWHHTYKLPTLTTNCSNNYGPYQHHEKLIPYTIMSALNHHPITIYGDGKNIRDWLFVDDHCSGILNVMQFGKIGQTYNIGGNNEYQNIQIVKKICSIIDKLKPMECDNKKFKSYSDLITFVSDRPGHDYRYSINSSKLTNETGWIPEKTFDQGIQETVEWYLKNQDWIRPLPSKK
jgi:dTDP-glucose 4,6-dehydratase